MSSWGDEEQAPRRFFPQRGCCAHATGGDSSFFRNRKRARDRPTTTRRRNGGWSTQRFFHQVREGGGAGCCRAAHRASHLASRTDTLRTFRRFILETSRSTTRGPASTASEQNSPHRRRDASPRGALFRRCLSAADVSSRGLAFSCLPVRSRRHSAFIGHQVCILATRGDPRAAEDAGETDERSLE